jgi:hypothetical protein
VTHTMSNYSTLWVHPTRSVRRSSGLVYLTTRSVSEIVLELVGRLNHFTSARQLKSSASICSVRR